MFKSFLSTAILSTLLITATPAFAIDCAAGRATDEIVIKTTDSAQKTAAMKRMALARERMAARDDAGCNGHFNDGMKSGQ